ncbi:MAG: hypothetical protein MUC92_12505 [Fimbriimonadaceae bacterium]|jgi:hypothetical protein|nr:hypothetical protein [Fimbriimonadaceae bacterium]
MVVAATFGLFLVGAALQPIIQLGHTGLEYPQALPLGGYTERRDKVFDPGGDPLWVRVASVKQGETHILFIMFEGLTIPESLYSAVREKIDQKGLEKVKLFLSASHTHCAPDTQMLNSRMTFKIPGIATFQRRWLDWTANQISLAIDATLQSAPLSGKGSLTLTQAQVKANRARRPGALIDQTVSQISFGTKPLLTVFNAHPTFWDSARNQTSGDWPGLLANRTGGLVLTGPLGDSSPFSLKSTIGEKMEDMVENLLIGLNSAQPEELDARFAAVLADIVLGPPIPHPEFLTNNNLPEVLGQNIVSRFAPPSSFVTLVSWGRVVIVGVPGEPTSEVAWQIQNAAAQKGYTKAIVVSHVNGWVGYILTPEDYDRGGYEATLAFHGREFSTRLVEAVTRGLDQLGTARLR